MNLINIDNPKKICTARTKNGTRCSRVASINDFCKSHEKHTPYGLYDGINENKKKNISNKKQSITHKQQTTLSNIDEKIYIQTQTIQINEKTYLIDKNGILYNNNTECEIVGRSDGDYISWFV